MYLGVAVEQWWSQFKLWSTIDTRHICRFTSDNKDRPNGMNEYSVNNAIDILYLSLSLSSENTAIAISTYNMVAYTQKRAADSQEVS